MTKSKAGRKGQEFSLEFRQQALLRAATEGVTTVARDLGLQPASCTVGAPRRGGTTRTIRHNAWSWPNMHGSNVKWRGWRRRTLS
ncbi:hypothetical protein, partial [Variovorax sp.]|uniref:Transposase n=1 Tax=Herbaspirillum frisingense TaxID=92645 RepID=A0A7V8JS13_9BURK